MCKLCMKIFAISTMGEPALKSHASAKNFKLLLGCLKAWNQSVTISREKTLWLKNRRKNPLEEEKQSGETSLSSENQSNITKYALRKEQSKAEILRALKSVMSHFSCSSSKDIADTFRAMFPDSRIVHNMSCGCTKLSYLICFGIAPFFKWQLLADLKKAP